MSKMKVALIIKISGKTAKKRLNMWDGREAEFSFHFRSTELLTQRAHALKTPQISIDAMFCFLSWQDNPFCSSGEEAIRGGPSLYSRSRKGGVPRPKTTLQFRTFIRNHMSRSRSLIPFSYVRRALTSVGLSNGTYLSKDFFETLETLILTLEDSTRFLVRRPSVEQF